MSLSIPDFSLFFILKLQSHWKKVTPFPSNSPLKTEVLSNSPPPPFFFFVNCRKGGGVDTMNPYLCSNILGWGQHDENWTSQDLWNLIIINLYSKSFHNFIDWSGLYLRLYITPCLEKIFRLKVFRLFGKCICDILPSPWYDLIISPPIVE